MSTENLTQTVELIAMALSEDGGYEYYHVNDTLKELAKDVADMQAENVKLWELSKDLFSALFNEASRQHVTTIGEMQGFLDRMAELKHFSASERERDELRELGIEVDE